MNTKSWRHPVDQGNLFQTRHIETNPETYHYWTASLPCYRNVLAIYNTVKAELAENLGVSHLKDRATDSKTDT